MKVSDSEEIRIRVYRKATVPSGMGWKLMGMYSFSTPEKIKATIDYLNSHCDQPILDEYVRFLDGLIR